MDRRQLMAGAGAMLCIGPLGRFAFAEPAGKARFEISHSEAEWRRRLTPAEYRVLREAATERPWSSPLLNEKRAGVFACAGCALPLYRSEDKFDSGTGWPSFTRAIPRSVGTSTDDSLFMVRTAVHCHRCGGHLGHIFDDGPPPTGKRHCINGLALHFVPTRRSPT